jgi:hypothetical protein
VRERPTLHAEGKPRVVRVDAGPAPSRLLDKTPALVVYLTAAAVRALGVREGAGRIDDADATEEQVDDERARRR